MREQLEIQEKFEALVKQKDICENGSAAYNILNHYARALAWVLQDAQVEELLLSEDSRSLLDCVS